MAKREIGTSLKLDGEAQFKAAISNINQELRVLSSEMGMTVSAFDKSSASISDLKAKGDVYEKQLDTQKEKLAVLNNALKAAEEAQAKAAQTAAEMAEKYGADSTEAQKASEAVAGITKKLNDYQIQANNTTRNINQLEAAQKANNEEIENLRSKNHKKILEDIAEGAKKAAAGVNEIAKESAKITVDTVKAYGAALGAVATAAGAIAVKLGKEVVSAYADYEQLVGGVDTLFKESSETLQQYAANAYKTAGMNANDYMETVTGFSASLIQSLGGDTEKAVDYASMAITDMSDNANKMGSDISTIQSAYQGFAKQNYTMLDNLKLGYGGTKEEMQRLLDDAQAISGIEYDISSYADIVSAIHVMQESMDIAGTTAKEAESTISGSINSMQAALQNLIVGFGREDADIKQLCQNVVDSFQKVVTNITPVIDNIVQALPTAADAILESVSGLLPQLLGTLLSMLPDITVTILDIIQELAQTIAEELPEMIDSLLPTAIRSFNSFISGMVAAIPSLVPYLLKGAATLFKGILDGLNQVISQLTPMLPVIVSDISDIIVQNIPVLVTGAAQFFTGIVTAIAMVLPSIIEAVVEIIPVICNSIIENIPLLIDAGLQLFVSLTEALPYAIVEIVAALPEIIIGIVAVLLDSVPQMIQTGVDLFLALIDALPEIIETIVDSLPQIINGIVTGLLTSLPKIIQAGVTLFLGLIDALPEIIIAIVDALPQIIDGIVNGLVESLPIIIQAGFDLFVSLISDLPRIIIELVAAIPQIISSIVNAFKESFGKMKDIGANLIAGIGDGLIEGVTAVKDKIKSAGDKIMSSFKEYFGIASPSKVMKKELGFNLADGVGVGFSEQMERVSADMKKSVPTSFDLDVDINSSAMYRKKYSAIASESGGGVNFTQINNSPKALDAETINRQTRQGLQLANVMR